MYHLPSSVIETNILLCKSNVVAAKLRLGYKAVWQVSQAEDVPYYSYKLCDSPNANAMIKLLALGQDLLQICTHLHMSYSPSRFWWMLIICLFIFVCVGVPQRTLRNTGALCLGL